MLIIVIMNILGIETSCDETSASILVDGVIRSNIVSSQFVHKKYGGIVPELASRAHQQLIVPVVNEALQTSGIDHHQLHGIAVTYGPGLMGALMVGLNFAKAFSYGLNIPFIGVNHMEAHIYSNFIGDPKPHYPFLCLIVSGGHTQLAIMKAPFEKELLGETLDDAAGEAFDKVSKMLDLGFPGGPIIDKLASKGNPHLVEFPRSFLDGNNFNFSFSGVKTAVLYWLRDQKNGHRSLDEQTRADICASFQAAVIDVLVEKTIRAAHQFGVQDIAVAGGVSANSELRKQMHRQCQEENFRLFIPAFEYCTDNAAMIAMVGWMKLQRGMRSSYDLNAVPNLAFT